MGNTVMIHRGLLLAGCIVLLMLQMPVVAQQCVWNIPQPERMWAITDINRHIGSLDIAQDYTHSFSGGGIREEGMHSFRVNTSAGMTRLFDVFSVAPTTRGSCFYKDTIIGYDPQNTTARLVGGESTRIGALYSRNELCGPAGRICGVAGSQFNLNRGFVHSSLSTNTPMSLADYEFTSSGEGTVRTGSAVASGTGNAQTHYSQRMVVNGRFEHVSYSASFNLQ